MAEFCCYYLGDELDDWIGPSFVARIEEMAADSAQRISWFGGAPSAAPVAALLRSMASDRRHFLFEQVMEGTLIAWMDDDAWPVFAQLALAIAGRLDGQSTHRAP